MSEIEDQKEFEAFTKRITERFVEHVRSIILHREMERIFTQKSPFRIANPQGGEETFIRGPTRGERGRGGEPTRGEREPNQRDDTGVNLSNEGFS